MRPRCAHDLKPMCYLLQSLTEQLLDDKIAFAAEEREALRKELRKKSDRLDAYVRACGADAPERAEEAAAAKIQAAARGLSDLEFREATSHVCTVRVR